LAAAEQLGAEWAGTAKAIDQDVAIMLTNLQP
jgi:hypothetical protein